MSEFCPLCLSKGRRAPLKFLRLNLSEATKMCSDVKCPYPFGIAYIDTFVKVNFMDFIEDVDTKLDLKSLPEPIPVTFSTLDLKPEPSRDVSIPATSQSQPVDEILNSDKLLEMLDFDEFNITGDVTDFDLDSEFSEFFENTLDMTVQSGVEGVGHNALLTSNNCLSENVLSDYNVGENQNEMSTSNVSNGVNTLLISSDSNSQHVMPVHDSNNTTVLSGESVNNIQDTSTNSQRTLSIYNDVNNEKVLSMESDNHHTSAGNNFDSSSVTDGSSQNVLSANDICNSQVLVHGDRNGGTVPPEDSVNEGQSLLSVNKDTSEPHIGFLANNFASQADDDKTETLNNVGSQVAPFAKLEEIDEGHSSDPLETVRSCDKTSELSICFENTTSIEKHEEKATVSLNLNRELSSVSSFEDVKNLPLNGDAVTACVDLMHIPEMDSSVVRAVTSDCRAATNLNCVKDETKSNNDAFNMQNLLAEHSYFKLNEESKEIGMTDSSVATDQGFVTEDWIVEMCDGPVSCDVNDTLSRSTDVADTAVETKVDDSFGYANGISSGNLNNLQFTTDGRTVLNTDNTIPVGSDEMVLSNQVGSEHMTMKRDFKFNVPYGAAKPQDRLVNTATTVGNTSIGDNKLPTVQGLVNIGPNSNMIVVKCAKNSPIPDLSNLGKNVVSVMYVRPQGAQTVVSPNQQDISALQWPGIPTPATQQFSSANFVLASDELTLSLNGAKTCGPNQKGRKKQVAPQKPIAQIRNNGLPVAKQQSSLKPQLKLDMNKGKFAAFSFDTLVSETPKRTYVRSKGGPRVRKLSKGRNSKATQDKVISAS